MNYRDDRDALRSEVDTLQKELASARDDRERLAGLERRLDAARAEVNAVEAELARATGYAPRRSRALVVGLVVAATVSAAAGAYLFTRSAARPALAPLPRLALPLPSLSPTVPSVVTAMPAKAAAPEPEAPTPPRRANATWRATVTKAHGLALAVGSPCTIRAAVVPDSTGMHATDVEVTCGGHTIYDQKLPLSGMSMLDSDAKQRPSGKAGSWVYEIAYRDRGDRASSRNQADLNSTAKVGKVWSDNLPELRIDLAIQAGSAPVDVAIVE